MKTPRLPHLHGQVPADVQGVEVAEVEFDQRFTEVADDVVDLVCVGAVVEQVSCSRVASGRKFIPFSSQLAINKGIIFFSSNAWYIERHLVKCP